MKMLFWLFSLLALAFFFTAVYFTVVGAFRVNLFLGGAVTFCWSMVFTFVANSIGKK